MKPMQLKHWQDPVTALLGAWFSVSPWLLKFQDNVPALWTAVGIGVLLVLLGLSAVFKPQSWEHWVAGLAGIFAAASPWGLDFAQHASASNNALVVGLVVVVLSAWALIEGGEVRWHRDDGLAH